MSDATTPVPQSVSARALSCFQTGLVKAVRTTVWLLKYIIPTSLAVAALQQAGALGVIAHWIAPAFQLVGLPGEAALPFLAGALLNVYSGLAAMAPLDLTARQITILSLMILISHNLPIETVVQHKAGTPGWRLVLLRLGASAAAAVALNLLMPDVGAGQARHLEAAGAATWSEALRAWAIATAWLIGKIALFVSGVMVLQRLLEEFGVMPLLSRLLALPLALLGLPRNTVFLWVVANTLGLAYGAGVLLEETRSGRLTREEIEIINRSVAICHSLLEDTLLCVAVGASAFWITVPRLVLAAAAVWGDRAATRRRMPEAG